MGEEARHKGWHSRGYLPHLDAPKEIQAVTFRLADAMPGKLVEAWRQELDAMPGTARRLPRSTSLGEEHEITAQRSQREKILRQRIAKYEDAGHGECVLRDHGCAELLLNELLFRDGESYRLLEWCIMPNHVHVLIHGMPGIALGTVVRRWKTFSARGINERMGRLGPLWAKDYHDRYIRDAEHLANARAYIRHNPVKAGLCSKPEDWAWGSAGWRTQDFSL